MLLCLQGWRFNTLRFLRTFRVREDRRVGGCRRSGRDHRERGRGVGEGWEDLRWLARSLARRLDARRMTERATSCTADGDGDGIRRHARPTGHRISALPVFSPLPARALARALTTPSTLVVGCHRRQGHHHPSCIMDRSSTSFSSQRYIS